RVARDLGESGPGRGAVGEDGTDYRTVADAVRRVASEPEQIGCRFRRRDGTEVVHVATAVVAADEAAHAFDGAVRLFEHHTHRARLTSAAPAATAVGPPAAAAASMCRYRMGRLSARGCRSGTWPRADRSSGLTRTSPACAGRDRDPSARCA